MSSRDGPVVRMAVTLTDLLTHGFAVAEQTRSRRLPLCWTPLTGNDVLLTWAVGGSVAVEARQRPQPAVDAGGSQPGGSPTHTTTACWSARGR
jgi:hypothetical protein